ncbi:hypothetical protein NDU88_000910 [Pleurodeles waltl]|uniref:Uncharacterized protein n=1 Tax=Pleurodeles waltl TaxID=8319 RepID=A0AAV7L814_PLEWA|nr:hypothetical protein NDU88_000910 [Pleurodeles waltl]
MSRSFCGRTWSEQNCRVHFETRFANARFAVDLRTPVGYGNIWTFADLESGLAPINWKHTSDKLDLHIPAEGVP